MKKLLLIFSFILFSQSGLRAGPLTYSNALPYTVTLEFYIHTNNGAWRQPATFVLLPGQVYNFPHLSFTSVFDSYRFETADVTLPAASVSLPYVVSSSLYSSFFSGYTGYLFLWGSGVLVCFGLAFFIFRN